MFKHTPWAVRKSLDEVVLVWGSRSFTRHQMIKKLSLGNFRAARIVTAALEELDVRTPSQLWETDPYELRNLKGVGDFSLYICMVLLDSVGKDPSEWFELHVEERRRNRRRMAEEKSLRQEQRAMRA